MTHPQDEPALPARRRWSGTFSRVRTRIRRAAPFASGVVAAMVAVVLYGLAVPGPRSLTQQDVNGDISKALASVTPGPALSQRAYLAVQPALVLIQTQVASSTAAPSSAATASAAASPGGVAAADGSVGSGVVVDTSGDILTCLHLVANATSIQLTFADGTTSPGEVAATQPANDIAVLQATQPPAQFKPAILGNPRRVQVGSEAFVVGNPFGLPSSMSSGIVSGLNRSFQLPDNGPLLQGLIQVDAAVNPGSSGGPLVNRDGQVIGIVDALINPTNDVFIGIGLAVPIDVAGRAAGLPPD